MVFPVHSGINPYPHGPKTAENDKTAKNSENSENTLSAFWKPGFETVRNDTFPDSDRLRVQEFATFAILPLFD